MVIRKYKGIFLTIFLLSMMIGGCSVLAQFQSRQTSEVQELTFAAVKGSIHASVDMIGYVEYNQSGTLAWKTNGVISQVNVQLGDTVKKGDILAELETDSLSSAVILAEKTLIEAQDNLTEVMESSTAKVTALSTLTANETALQATKQAQESLYYPRADQLTIEMAYDEYMLALQNFNYAKADYDSVRNQKGWEDAARQTYFESYSSTYSTMITAYENWVWTKGEPTDTELAVAQGAVMVAQQAYDDALETYESYETLPRQKDLQAAEISLTNAENSYNKRNVLATFSGTVTSISAESGHYVTSGTEAFQVDDMSRILIPVDVSEIDIHKIYTGQRVIISLDAITDKTYSGVISKISELGEGSGTTVTFETIIEITDADEAIKAGMTAAVEIILEEKSDVVLIPLNAITTAGEKSTVTVQNTGGNRQVEVQIGLTTNLLAEITSGLAEGDLIVVPSIDNQVYTELGISPSGITFPGIPEGGVSFGDSGSEMPGLPTDAGQTGVRPGTGESNEGLTDAVAPTQAVSSEANLSTGDLPAMGNGRPGGEFDPASGGFSGTGMPPRQEPGGTLVAPDGIFQSTPTPSPTQSSK